MTRLMQQLGDLAGSDMVLARAGSLERPGDSALGGLASRAPDGWSTSPGRASARGISRRVVLALARANSTSRPDSDR